MHNAIALVPELVCISEMMYDMANDGSLAKEFAGKVLNSIAKTTRPVNTLTNHVTILRDEINRKII